MAKAASQCDWVGLKDALAQFVSGKSTHQSAGHIKPLHWYVACRLVLEGGFHPDDITPRPPFKVTAGKSKVGLIYDPHGGGRGEQTVFGGLKTKDVDVVVSKTGVGPVLAVSVKGTLKSYRNLTNRMEEAVGDCTNLHISYPALVYGFFHVMRASRAGPKIRTDDVAVEKSGRISESILRYHDVICRLTARNDLRDDPSRYEAVALVLVSPETGTAGEILSSFPESSSPLLLKDFFRKLYDSYDQRFVYAAPSLGKVTRRHEWSIDDKIATDSRLHGYDPRVAT